MKTVLARWCLSPPRRRSPPALGVFPEDENHTLAGGAATVTMPFIDFPPEFSGSFVPPTPVRLLASGTVLVELFRGDSTAHEFCSVAFVGHFIRSKDA